MSNAEALKTAIQEGSTEIVKGLLNAGVVPNEDSLYTACLYGRADIVQLLLPVGLDYTAPSGSSPLHSACKAGKVPFGYDIYDQRSDYETTVTLLVTRAPHLINKVNHDEDTPLMTALRRENFNLAKILLTYGAEVKNIADSGETALSIAVNHECDPLLIEQLIQAGSNLNHRDHRGRTPLFIAVMDHSMEIIKILLEYGADPNIVDNDGYSIFNIAGSEIIESIKID